MTVRNLKVVSRRSNAPWHPDTIYLTCEMMDHATGEWFRQDIQALEDVVFKRLSDWNVKYDTPEVHAATVSMLRDIEEWGCE
jgi:hypothetical protein